MNAYSEDLGKKSVEAVCERGVGKSEAARSEEETRLEEETRRGGSGSLGGGC